MGAVSQAAGEQRIGADRRSFGWKTVFYGFLRSRRHRHRRTADSEGLFIDWHHPWLFFLAVGVMIMSCIDAFMTLQLLDRGMVEANPIMAAVLSQGTGVFAATKLAMTGTSILILVFLAKANFMDRIRAGALLTVFFLVYACLVCYQFVNLIRDM